MDRGPKIEERPQQHYAGVAGEAADEGEFRRFVDAYFPELFAWLGSQGVEPAAPFIRYLEVASDGQPLRFELGVPTPAAPNPDGRVHAGTLPAGRYATYLHVGPYTHAEVPDLNAARDELTTWAAGEGLTLAAAATPRGTAYEANVERYLTDASREPDWTQLAFLIADD
jgi:effector-binding domain-containing protein